jgi:predicted CoA-substrate-specific enzyme activase
MTNSSTTAGVDIGSLTTTALVLRGEDILGSATVLTLADGRSAAKDAFEQALDRAGLSSVQINCVVATGYGRGAIDFADATLTEITCHAVGARKLFPEVRTVIDIGGQDSKVIRLGTDGRVEDFLMNDKCAAGTGRFLEVMAAALDTDVDSLGQLASRSTANIRISSTCTVFAESEVVALVAKGVPKEDIIGGLHSAIAERIYSMVSRLRAKSPFAMSGGVARNSGVAAAIAKRLDAQLLIPPDPQIVGALGAALSAGKEFAKTAFPH